MAAFINKFKETGDSRYIYENKLDKGCFQHDIAYGDFEDLSRRTVADKVLHDKPFNIAKNPNMLDINVVLLQWLINLVIKTSAGTVKNKIISNKELAEELHKQVNKKIEKRKAHPSFTDNIWGADLADMQLRSKFNKGFRFLLCY